MTEYAKYVVEEIVETEAVHLERAVDEIKSIELKWFKSTNMLIRVEVLKKYIDSKKKFIEILQSDLA